jgi:crotonobetainyl-CoA:carnitine CoA-transferase CaiB-like acyl-CoA transferase
MESTLADYTYKGIIRERTGNSHFSTVPGGHYLTKDQKYLVLAVGGDKVFSLFAKAVGRPEMAEDERYSTAAARARNRKELDWQDGSKLDFSAYAGRMHGDIRGLDS